MSRTTYRAVLLACILLSSIVLGSSFAAAIVTGSESHWQTDASYSEHPHAAAPPTENVTVVTTQVFRDWVNEGEIVAFRPNGSVLYYDDSRSTYHDVDPSPVGERTVLYLAADYLSASNCPSGEPCTRNQILRTNLTTGETTVVHGTYLPDRYKWHDVDRLSATQYLVADIVNDRVFVLDTQSDSVGWRWNASSEYPHSGGGPYPEDWTHLNDVEKLADGRVMISLRNQDQVAFVDPGRGLQESWTLGAENRYRTLYEQHNPDYLPAGNGGPAVLVADSENNRIVEYQRSNGGWERSWTWRDARLQWPRDADRLPNGNTLVTDTNGNRIVEVTPQGETVWQVSIGLPYEAERLGTGDESANGPSMHRLVPSATRTDARSSLLGEVVLGLKGILPAKLVSGVLFVLPAWMGTLDYVAGGVLLGSLLGWLGLELYWRSETVLALVSDAY